MMMMRMRQGLGAVRGRSRSQVLWSRPQSQPTKEWPSWGHNRPQYGFDAGFCRTHYSHHSSSSVVQRQQRRRRPQTLFQWYSHRLDTHPITTKCASAGAIATVGNILAQRIGHSRRQTVTVEEQEPETTDFEVDWNKVGRFAFLNVAYVAPVLHYWYQFVNRAVPGISLSAVLQRVFWDEFVFTPVYLPIFMGGLWSLEGMAPEKLPNVLWKEMPRIIAAEWILWVPTMFFTFRYAPVKYQVLVINCVGVAWQTFLSLAAQQAHSHHSNEESTTAAASSSSAAASTNSHTKKKKMCNNATTLLPVDAPNVYDFFDFHSDSQ